MEIVSVAFGAVTAAEECLRLGKAFKNKYDRYRSMHLEIPETIIQLRVRWQLGEIQIREIKAKCLQFNDELQLTCVGILIIGRTMFERAQSVKEALTEMATILLPVRMGQKYADIVMSCLTCLDPNNTDFGDEPEFLDEDGIGVGMRYMQKISLKLQAIQT